MAHLPWEAWKDSLLENELLGKTLHPDTDCRAEKENTEH